MDHLELITRVDYLEAKLAATGEALLRTIGALEQAQAFDNAGLESALLGVRWPASPLEQPARQAMRLYCARLRKARSIRDDRSVARATSSLRGKNGPRLFLVSEQGAKIGPV